MSPSVALELTQSLLTNGARAAAIFFVQSCYFLAIPQLARDIPGSPTGMNNGDSNTSLMLYRTVEGKSDFKEFQQLDVPGGESAEFFTVDDRVFLATASLRSGSYPNYTMDIQSCIFEWNGDTMTEFQCIPTYGAKQWRYFDISGRHFLALAQGPGTDTVIPTHYSTNSTIFEWNGDSFESFQAVPTSMGYNWHHFRLEDRDFLAYADHLHSSYVLEWKGDEFVPFQTMDGTSGRAFFFFEKNNRAYLAFARVSTDSLVYTWNGQQFQQHQILPGAGGREFTMIKDGEAAYLVYIKFLTGSLDTPTTTLNSTIYIVEEDGIEIVTQFPTFGGTDASTFSLNGETWLVVTNSLTPDVLFRQDSYVYRFLSKSSFGNSTWPLEKRKMPFNTDIISQKSHSAEVGNVDEMKLATCTHVGTASQELPRHRKRATGYTTPQFIDLFTTYTGTNGIGYQLRNATAETLASYPMLLATSTDLILFPGNGSDPSTMEFRLGSHGFMELASISHLGPTIASLVQIRLLNEEDENWLTNVQDLINKTRAAQAANSEDLWKDKIQVEAFRGREGNISAMIDYACKATLRLLNLVVADPTKFDAKYVRDNFLEATGNALNATIPYNHVMIATFFLVGLDTAYRMQQWLLQYDIDWTKAMVMISGQQGRETAGVTLSTNTVAQVFIASLPDLPLERIFIAPHGPAPVLNSTTPDYLRQFEPESRRLWGALYGMAQLGAAMFEGYPAYKVTEDPSPTINSSTTSVSEMPVIGGPEDWTALITRMRVVLEDVRQLLSGCVVDYAAQQLYAADYNYTNIVVPGLDGYDFASAAAQIFT